MTNIEKDQAIAMDKAHCWHPFTRQSEWCDAGHEPLMLVSGKGVWLTDIDGNSYIDGNASIWTNVHGHQHPDINAAIVSQLNTVAHTSYLGYGHPLASELAAKLVNFFPENTLERVFYSDDGSTAGECALKMAVQYRMQTGEPERNEFVAFHNGYHGDTLGAASLGGVEAFFERFRKLGLTVHFVRSLEDLQAWDVAKLKNIAGVIIEPIVQGVNQIHIWPEGMLRDLRCWTQTHGIHLILDEVMTGFGKTGTMFACQKEDVIPDFLCLAKGLTGGYLPMAATLTTADVYNAFLGEASKAFYYGHSYTANPLGCAAALANLEIFEKEETLSGVNKKRKYLFKLFDELKYKSKFIFDIRQVGLVSGIELRQPDGTKFALADRVGEQVCLVARKHQLLTRPILDTIVFMPPLSITEEEIQIAVSAIEAAIDEVLS